MPRNRRRKCSDKQEVTGSKTDGIEFLTRTLRHRAIRSSNPDLRAMEIHTYTVKTCQRLGAATPVRRIVLCQRFSPRLVDDRYNTDGSFESVYPEDRGATASVLSADRVPEHIQDRYIGRWNVASSRVESRRLEEADSRGESAGELHRSRFLPRFFYNCRDRLVSISRACIRSADKRVTPHP